MLEIDQNRSCRATNQKRSKIFKRGSRGTNFEGCAAAAWLRRGRACQEQREEAHGFMTLRRGGAAPAVLCVSAVRERVRGARVVALCAPFAWQTVPSTLLASVFMCASLIDFFSEKFFQRTRLRPQRSLHRLFGPSARPQA